MTDARPVVEFVRELAATYTDWPMDDPLVIFDRCHFCVTERLCRPIDIMRLAVPVVGVYSQPGFEVQRTMCCGPCYHLRPERAR